MLIPAQRLLELMRGEFAATLMPAGSDVSVGRAFAVSLALLDKREAGGAQAVQHQFERLERLLVQLRALSLPSAVLIDMERLDASAAAARHEIALPSLEASWREALAQLERIAETATRQADPDAAAQCIALLSDWEVAERTGELDELESAATDNGQVTLGSLQQYLRTKFDDPSITVASFQPLPGGFGKQTYLFATEGRSLAGSFVMRRDFPRPLVDNDCHRIGNEFEVIRAVRSRGFPAPDALWLESDPNALPVGSFIIMQRAPGAAGGTVIGPRGLVTDELTETLARILAEIHALPGMPELANLTESINRERQEMPLGECVRAYLESWPGLLESTPHEHSPAGQAMMQWLLANIPEIEGRPALLHGDIGFHNFLFDQDRLTAVLDWEFAHFGDPAEELAAVRNNLGASLDWPKFLHFYRAAGGIKVSPERIHFFQVWGHVRNALTSALAASTFIGGAQDDLKFILTPHIYVPHFLNSARAILARGPTE